MMTTLRGTAPGRRSSRALGLAGGVAAVLICAGCASSSPATNPRAAARVLGRPAGVFAHGAGFGQVKPAKIFNGGDPTGLLTHVTWKSWGGAVAVGTGKTDYVGPSQSVATGKEEHATVEAFQLGKCHRKLMYKAVEWYFPQHGQSFSASHYQNICKGTYVPSP